MPKFWCHLRVVSSSVPFGYARPLASEPFIVRITSDNMAIRDLGSAYLCTQSCLVLITRSLLHLGVPGTCRGKARQSTQSPQVAYRPSRVIYLPGLFSEALSPELVSLTATFSTWGSQVPVVTEHHSVPSLPRSRWQFGLDSLVTRRGQLHWLLIRGGRFFAL
jgi:hypothetical protein